LALVVAVVVVAVMIDVVIVVVRVASTNHMSRTCVQHHQVWPLALGEFFEVSDHGDALQRLALSARTVKLVEEWGREKEGKWLGGRSANSCACVCVCMCVVIAPGPSRRPGCRRCRCDTA
jgi:hypothetical protein